MYRLADLKMEQYDYAAWLRYFIRNERTPLNCEFTEADILDHELSSLVFPSICEFAKGESSDGRHLMETVRKFAKTQNIPECEETFRKFIAEENRHSSYLKQFMDHNRISEKNHSLLDNIFRRMRKAGGFYGEAMVLVTAEIIALSYYRALSECTDSPALKAICAQMLHDELPHIIFQSYNLSHFSTSAELRRLIMDGASLAQWSAHRNVYKAGGYTLKRLLKENHGYLRQSERLMKTMRVSGPSKIIEASAV